MGCNSQKAGSIFSAVQAEIYMGRGAGASRGFFRESDQVSRREQWQLNPGWLMISWGILLPFIYWGFFDNPRTGNPELNQPGFNGMIEGCISHCSHGKNLETSFKQMGKIVVIDAVVPSHRWKSIHHH